jgi:hypothetical protein
MEIGSKGSSFLGVSQSQENAVTLTTVVQRLTQLSVADIDMKWKSWTPPRAATPLKKGKRTSKKSGTDA